MFHIHTLTNTIYSGVIPNFGISTDYIFMFEVVAMRVMWPLASNVGEIGQNFIRNLIPLAPHTSPTERNGDYHRFLFYGYVGIYINLFLFPTYTTFPHLQKI